MFTAGSAACIVTDAFWGVLAGRVLQALAAGVITPMCITILMLSVPKEKRGTAMGIASIVLSIAPALGPTVSGAFVDNFSWRGVFFLSGALAVIMLFVGVIVLKNFDGFQESSFDLLSVVYSTLGLFGLLYGLSTFSDSDKRIVSIICMAAGIVIIMLFVKRQLNLDRPLLEIKAFKVRNFSISAVAPSFMQAVIYGGMVIVPIFIQDIIGQSATVSGLVMMPGAIFGAFTAFVSGRLFDRYGVRVLALTGAILMTASTVVLALLPATTTVVMVGCTYTVLTIAMQIVVTPLKTWGLNSLDNTMVPHGTPIQSTMISVGGSLGTAVVVSVGALASSTYMQVHIGFGCMAAFACIYLSLIVILVKN